VDGSIPDARVARLGRDQIFMVCEKSQLVLIGQVTVRGASGAAIAPHALEPAARPLQHVAAMAAGMGKGDVFQGWVERHVGTPLT
jgi:hypothetical protein